MARKSKRDWLDAGLQVLTELGTEHLTIETLTQKMGVTKGSFYHHFVNYDAFVESLLTYWETEGALNIIAALEHYPTAREKLERLLEITTAGRYAEEIALRAWALRNARVKEVLTRIDRQRLDYLITLCRALIPDAERAAAAAHLFYLTYVGGQQIGLDRAFIKHLYQTIDQLLLETSP